MSSGETDEGEGAWACCVRRVAQAARMLCIISLSQPCQWYTESP